MKNRNRTPRTPNPFVPPVEEWYFGKCPEGEILDCCLYEYARESEGFKEHYMAQYRETKAKDRSVTFVPLAGSAYGLSLNCPEFPAVPWLKIDRRTRRMRIRRLYDAQEAFSTSPALRRQDGTHVQQQPRFNPETGEEIALVEICWGLPLSKIVDDFTRWAAKTQNERRKKIARAAIWPERPGKTAASMLKALGAWRLLKQMDWDEAARISEDVLGRPLFQNQSAWNRAQTQARKFTG